MATGTREAQASLDPVRNALACALKAAPCRLSRTQATTGLAAWLVSCPPTAEAAVIALVASLYSAMEVTVQLTHRAAQASQDGGEEPSWDDEILCRTMSLHTALGVPAAILQLATRATPDRVSREAMLYCATYHACLSDLDQRYQHCPDRIGPPPAGFPAYLRDLAVLLPHVEASWPAMPAHSLGAFSKLVALMYGSWKGPGCRMDGFPMGRLVNLLALLLVERGSDETYVARYQTDHLSDMRATALHAVLTKANASCVSADYRVIKPLVVTAIVQKLSGPCFQPQTDRMLNSVPMLARLRTFRQPLTFDIGQELMDAQGLQVLCGVLDRSSCVKGAAKKQTRFQALQAANEAMRHAVRTPTEPRLATSMLGSGLLAHVAIAVAEPPQAAIPRVTPHAPMFQSEALSCLALLTTAIDSGSVTGQLLPADKRKLRAARCSGHLDAECERLIGAFLDTVAHAKLDAPECKSAEGSTGQKATKAATSSRSKARSCGNLACTNADPVKSFEKCSRCMAVAYCSRACQRTHWRSGHRANCVPTVAQVTKAAAKLNL